MKVKQFINSLFTSNSYIIYSEESEYVFVIDPGDSKPIIDWTILNNKHVKSIFITHSHFDHIYGVNDLQEKFPLINVYTSFYAKEGMMCEKLNGSLYMEIPFVIKRQDINIVKEGDQIQLWDNIYLNVFETPGHDRDCLSFYVENNLFTGDALIPGIKVHTKLKFSNKNLAEETIKRILEQFDNDIIIWPGHGENCVLETLKQ